MIVNDHIMKCLSRTFHIMSHFGVPASIADACGRPCNKAREDVHLIG